MIQKLLQTNYRNKALDTAVIKRNCDKSQEAKSTNFYCTRFQKDISVKLIAIKRYFCNFSCIFLNFSSLNSNCSYLIDVRNLQEQVKHLFKQFLITAGHNNFGNKIPFLKWASIQDFCKWLCTNCVAPDFKDLTSKMLNMQLTH